MTLFWLAAGWLAGLALGDISPFSAAQWAVLALIAAAMLVWTRRQPAPRLLFGLALAASLAGGRMALANEVPAPTALLHFNGLGEPVQLHGRVAALPQPESDYTALTIQATAIRSLDGSWTDLHGLVLARASPRTGWQYGDLVELTGTLETPPVFETFSYRQYLARRGIHSLMNVRSGRRLARAPSWNPLALLSRYRTFALSVLHRLFPEPESSLLAGILLGIEGGIPDGVRDAFNRTGTTHIIAISGFNISIVAGLFTRLFGRWWGVRRGSWIAALGVGAYTVLVGADPAVVRAAVMALLAMLAQRLGRRSDGYNALAAAAIFMTALDPYQAWDAGFQLSFAATLGLLLYGERLQAAFERSIATAFSLSKEVSQRLGSPVGEYLLLTLAAQITTLPLMLYYFGRLSVVSPLANLLILPAQPAVMIFGGLATLAGSLSSTAAQPLAWLAWPFPAYTIRVVEQLAALPAASLALPPLSLPTLAGLYLGIAAFSLILIHAPSRPERKLSTPAYAAAVVALALATVLTWQAALDKPDGKLHITLLDVKTGEAILIETPDGRTMLVNGGASSIDLGQALDSRMSLFSRRLDWLVLTASDEDAIGAIANLIERYPIGGMLVAAEPGGSAYQALLASAQASGHPVGMADDGLHFELGGSQHLTLVDVGASGYALLVESPPARILLAPRAQAGWIQQLPAWLRDTPLTALLLPDAGNAAVSPPDDVLALDPQVVLIAVGDGAARGLPSTSLSQALASRTLLRTDQRGWIDLQLTPGSLSIEVERSRAQGDS